MPVPGQALTQLRCCDQLLFFFFLILIFESFTDASLFPPVAHLHLVPTWPQARTTLLSVLIGNADMQIRSLVNLFLTPFPLPSEIFFF